MGKEWLRDFGKELGLASSKDPGLAERWGNVKAALSCLSRKAGVPTHVGAGNALKGLAKLWKMKPKTAKQLKSRKTQASGHGKIVKAALNCGVLSMERWDVLKSAILGESVEEEAHDVGGGGVEDGEGGEGSEGGEGGESVEGVEDDEGNEGNEDDEGGEGDDDDEGDEGNEGFLVADPGSSARSCCGEFLPVSTSSI